MNLLDLLAVAPKKGIPADDGDLFKHLHAVFQVAHAGPLIVMPTHRHLDDLVSALEGDEENLRIESPSLDGLELEDRLRGGAGKCLEAALGIGESQAHRRPGDSVEAAPKKLPVKRLAVRLA